MNKFYPVFLSTLLFPIISFAQSEIVKLSKAPLSIVGKTSPKGVAIDIAIAGSPQAPVVTTADNPPRLIVDFSGTKLLLTRTVVANPNPIVKAVRVGSHPDKVRVVVDLSGDTLPFYTSDMKKTSVSLVIKPPSSPALANTTAAVSTAPAPSTTTTTVAVTTTTMAPLEKAVVPANKVIPAQPVEETAPPEVQDDVKSLVPTPNVEEVSGPLVLSEVNFTHLEPNKTPTVQLALNHRTEFKLAKKSDKEYVLSLDQADIKGEHLTLPYFPPQDFEGITHVVVLKRGASVDVTIGVDRGMRIAAFSKDDGVYFKATK